MNKPLEVLVKECKEACLKGQTKEKCWLSMKEYSLCEYTGKVLYEPINKYFMQCNLYGKVERKK